jgi:hypothetical protein
MCMTNAPKTHTLVSSTQHRSTAVECPAVWPNHPSEGLLASRGPSTPLTHTHTPAVMQDTPRVITPTPHTRGVSKWPEEAARKGILQGRWALSRVRPPSQGFCGGEKGGRDCWVPVSAFSQPTPFTQNNTTHDLTRVSLNDGSCLLNELCTATHASNSKGHRRTQHLCNMCCCCVISRAMYKHQGHQVECPLSM